MKAAVFLVFLLVVLPAGGTSGMDDGVSRNDAVSDPKPKPAGEQKRYAYLGLRFRWANSTEAERFLHVDSVAPGGPAARAGVQPDDVITHVNRVPVGFGDELDFLIFLRERRPGERMALRVVRAGKSRELAVTLDALPEEAVAAWKEGFRHAQQKRAAKENARKTER